MCVSVLFGFVFLLLKKCLGFGEITQACKCVYSSEDLELSSPVGCKSVFFYTLKKKVYPLDMEAEASAACKGKDWVLEH